MGDWTSVIDPNVVTSRLVPVDVVGMGCMLIRSNVFYQLAKPWFQVNFMPEYNDYIGEDFYLCMQAKLAGVQCYIDTKASRLISHIGLMQYSFGDTA